MEKVRHAPSISVSSQNQVVPEELLQQVTLRRKRRQGQVIAVKQHLQKLNQELLRRTTICPYFFLFQLSLSVTVSVLNGLLLINIDSGNRSIYQGIVFLSIIIVLILKIWSNLKVTDWLTILNLYFYMDSITPNILTSCISMYTILSILPIWYWSTYLTAITIILWVIVLAGSLRVHIKCQNFTRLKIVCYKVCLFISGSVSCYVAYLFVTTESEKHQQKGIQSQRMYRNLLYLYLFAWVQYYWSLIKRIGDFDQTKHFKAEYELKSTKEKRVDTIEKVLMKGVQQEAEIDDIIDVVTVKVMTMRQIPFSDYFLNPIKGEWGERESHLTGKQSMISHKYGPNQEFSRY